MSAAARFGQLPRTLDNLPAEEVAYMIAYDRVEREREDRRRRPP